MSTENVGGFLTWPEGAQWALAVTMLVAFFAPVLGFVCWSAMVAPEWLWLLLPAYPLLVTVGQFAFAPFGRMSGLYCYLSPMLLVLLPSARRYALHHGTGFEYVLHFRWADRGPKARAEVMLFQIEGLLNLARLIEHNQVPPTVELVGTSYFFDERTIDKLGFEQIAPAAWERGMLLLGCIDLIWMYSFSQGRWAMPRVWGPRKMRTTGAQLVAQMPQLERLRAQLAKRARPVGRTGGAPAISLLSPSDSNGRPTCS